MNLPLIEYIRLYIITKQPRLEIRIGPAIRIPYKGLHGCQLPVSLALKIAVGQVEYTPH